MVWICIVISGKQDTECVHIRVGAFPKRLEKNRNETKRTQTTGTNQTSYLPACAGLTNDESHCSDDIWTVNGGLRFTESYQEDDFVIDVAEHDNERTRLPGRSLLFFPDHRYFGVDFDHFIRFRL